MQLKQLIEIVSPLSHTLVDTDKRVAGFSIDTRSLTSGEMFVALQGENAHGNAFAKNAMDQGAVAVLTDQAMDSDIPYILVADTLKALEDVGRYKRAHCSGKLVGVTGTAGKTSVKEALAFVLSQMGLQVHASQKSFNNHIGVPLTMANTPDGVDVIVAEMGMNSPGEILQHTQLCKPDVAVVTSIGPGHIEFFSSVEEIALEKVSIAAGASPDGCTVLPKDSERYILMKDTAEDKYKTRVVSFGQGAGSDVQLVSSQVAELHHTEVEVNVLGELVRYMLPTQNDVWINNSLAILAVVHSLGLSIHDAAKYFAQLKLFSGRGEVHEIQFEGKLITLIDDAYNANPLSMQAALRTLSKYSGRKVAVLGDMRELGEHSEVYHAKIGQLCRELGVDRVITCGEEMKVAYKQLSSEQQAEHVLDQTEVLPILSKILEGYDVVLFKASNGVKLHEVVSQIIRGLA